MDYENISKAQFLCLIWFYFFSSINGEINNTNHTYIRDPSLKVIYNKNKNTRNREKFPLQSGSIPEYSIQKENFLKDSHIYQSQRNKDNNV